MQVFVPKTFTGKKNFTITLIIKYRNYPGTGKYVEILLKSKKGEKNSKIVQMKQNTLVIFLDLLTSPRQAQS